MNIHNCGKYELLDLPQEMNLYIAYRTDLSEGSEILHSHLRDDYESGIPRVLDAGQCNDCYSLAVIALKLKEVFGVKDINDLPISFDIAWYEQKAVAVLLALLHLGFKNLRLGPTLPAFLSPGVAAVLVKTFDIKGITDPQADINAMMSGK